MKLLPFDSAVTEEVTGIDLVHSQMRLAAGEPVHSVLLSVIPRAGHAIEARIYAEDPVRFFSSPGQLSTFRMPEGDGIRVKPATRKATRCRCITAPWFPGDRAG